MLPPGQRQGELTVLSDCLRARVELLRAIEFGERVLRSVEAQVRAPKVVPHFCRRRLPLDGFTKAAGRLRKAAGLRFDEGEIVERARFARRESQPAAVREPGQVELMERSVRDAKVEPCVRG